jgi:hypothetical protein
VEYSESKTLMAVLPDQVTGGQAYPKQLQQALYSLVGKSLSFMGCIILPGSHLSFIIFYWVILNYVFLGIGHILEAGF